MLDAHGKIEFPVKSTEELQALIDQREADIVQLREEMWRYLHERNVAWKKVRALEIMLDPMKAFEGS